MKINKIDTYVMVALAFMPLLVSSAVAISTIGETTNDIPSVSYVKKYSTNNVSSYDDLVIGNYYEFSLKLYNPSAISSSTYPKILDSGYIDATTLGLTSVNLRFKNFYDRSYYDTPFDFIELLDFSYTSINFASTTINSGFGDINCFRSIDITSLNSMPFSCYFTTNFYYPYNTNNTYNNASSNTRTLQLLSFSFVFKFIESTINYGSYVGFISSVSDINNPIVSADLSTETVEDVFVRNLTYFNKVSFVKPIYNWCVTNMLGGVSNPIFDIAHSYLFYVMFLFLCYLMLSVLLFFVKFGIKALNWFYDKSFGGGS